MNAKDVRHLPGRPKTDKLDAVWLCKVAERQMTVGLPCHRSWKAGGKSRYVNNLQDVKPTAEAQGRLQRASNRYARQQMDGMVARSPRRWPI